MAGPAEVRPFVAVPKETDCFWGETPMATGRVKWFDVSRGFGFIINDQGQDVFVHYTSIHCDGFRALLEGQVVEYDEEVTAKGLSGKNVKVMRPGGSDASS